MNADYIKVECEECHRITEVHPDSNYQICGDCLQREIEERRYDRLIHSDE